MISSKWSGLFIIIGCLIKLGQSCLWVTASSRISVVPCLKRRKSSSGQRALLCHLHFAFQKHSWGLRCSAEGGGFQPPGGITGVYPEACPACHLYGSSKGGERVSCIRFGENHTEGSSWCPEAKSPIQRDLGRLDEWADKRHKIQQRQVQICTWEERGPCSDSVWELTGWRKAV